MADKEKSKKPYVKPVINQVSLKIEEAVLAACKQTLTGPGRGNRRCNHAACKKGILGS